jgi:CubicO group peptidase (beta-lactamase class C family)
MGGQNPANTSSPSMIPASDHTVQSVENIDQHCTVFYAANDQVALGGNNEDGYHPVLTRIWFIPPEEGRFGMALVGFDDFGNPEGAMNDQGLFFDGLAVRDVEVPLREGAQSYAGDAIMKIMSECGTVECALQFFNQYSLPGGWNGQWFLGDSHGNSAIIEPLKIIQKQGAFQVATNFFQSEVPPVDRTDARYVTATKMLSEADTFSVDLFRDTLNAVHQESGGVHTLYSTVYDLKQGLIYLYYFHDFEHVVTFDLEQELAKGVHAYDIPSLFPDSAAAVELGGKTPAELADLRAGLRQATLDPDLLRQYQGNYRLEVLPSYPDGKIFVKSENNRLFFRQPWTPWVEGIPQSNEHFIYVYSDPEANLHEVSLSFLRDASGQVTKLEVATDDSEKMSAIKLSPGFTEIEGGNSDRIDTYVQSQLEQVPNTALAYGIVHEGQIVHLKAFDPAHSSEHEVTPQTPFVVASVGKSFTGLAIRQLVNAGKVDLDTPVQKYIPWFTLADPESSARITVRHLLEHTSGIPNAAGNQANQLDPNYTTEQLVRMASNVKLNRPVGESAEYSNLNYLILGVLIETVSGESYPDYVREHIFLPLKMNHSYLSEAEAMQDNLVTGHQSWFGLMVPTHYPFPRGLLPAGDSISTAEDLSHLLIALLNDGTFEGVSVTDPNGTAAPEMHAGQNSYFDIHWVLKPCPCMNINDGQSGGAANYNADLQILPGKKWGVVVLMNSRFMLDGIIPSVTAASIANNVTYLLQDFAPVPSPRISYTQVYLIVDLILAALAAFSVYQVVRLVKTIRGRPGVSTLVIVLNLLLSLFILFGIPLLVGVLSGFPLQAGYKWDVLFIAFPDLTIVLLGSGVLLFVATLGQILLRVHKRRMQSRDTDPLKPTESSASISRS